MVSKTIDVGSIPTTPVKFDYIMAIVAKWLTHRVVVPTFVGSIPISRPLIGLWPSGKATVFGTVIPRFESW